MTSPIYVMWIRQIKRQWRSKARMIGALAQPILFLVALGYGFGSVFQRAGGGNYIEFLAPGIIVMSTLFSAMFAGIEVIWDRQFGFLKETLVTPASRVSLFVGRTLGGATIAFAQGIIVFLISLIFGFRPETWVNFPIALLLLAVVAVMFTALGTAIASRMQDMQAFPIIINFIIMPLFFLSGALFPLSGLPEALNIITKINPLSYGVDGIRSMLIGVSHFSLMTDLEVMLPVTIVISAIGSYLFSKIQI